MNDNQLFSFAFRLAELANPVVIAVNPVGFISDIELKNCFTIIGREILPKSY